MIRLASVVDRHLLRGGLHGWKVIAHPRKTGKRCEWRFVGHVLDFGFAVSANSRHITTPNGSYDRVADHP